MADLPKFDIPTEDVHGVTVRGLSRAEVMKLAALDLDDLIESEIHTVAVAFDRAYDEVKDWYYGTPSHVVQDIVQKIAELSGLGERGNEVSTPSSEG